jgi:glutamine phosphoribosylpyrophosphate amidotransferase
MCILRVLIHAWITSPFINHVYAWAKNLALKIKREWGEDHGIDVVIPIPDTSRTAALELANNLNVNTVKAL